MSKGHFTALMVGGLIALYPLAVFFGLRYIDPRWLSLLVIVVVGFRIVAGRLPKAMALGFAVALAASCGATLLTGGAMGLMLYPVMVNLVLCALFTASLKYPPSLIETLARLREPQLPPHAVEYTRKVTAVWAGFFALNGLLAAGTIKLGMSWWTLYNGLIAYVLMGILFAGEWLVRRQVRTRHNDA